MKTTGGEPGPGPPEADGPPKRLPARHFLLCLATAIPAGICGAELGIAVWMKGPLCLDVAGAFGSAAGGVVGLVFGILRTPVSAWMKALVTAGLAASAGFAVIRGLMILEI